MMGLKTIGFPAAVLLLVMGATASAQALPEGATYVAMGSSFAAGPAITDLAPGGTPRCGQSTDNYPRQLAHALKLTLIDRSCGGAVTEDVLGVGPAGLAPQLDGLTAQTRLVTVTIGGNDIRYMADLGVAACRHRGDGGTCTAPADFTLDKAFAKTEANMKLIAAEVRRRSPQARLVFVDYVTVLPSGPMCAAVAISDADGQELRVRAERLARLTEQVARQTGADLFKASTLTVDHNACAAEPWVAGFVQGTTPSGRARASFHPLLPAMTAIGSGLAQKLGR